jgi:hypothetical protein
MATPADDIKKVNEELAKTQDTLTSFVATFGDKFTKELKGASSALADMLKDARKLDENFAKGVDITKDLGKQLEKLKDQNEDLSIERQVAQKRLENAIKSGNDELIKRYKTEVKTLSIAIKLNEQIDAQVRKLQAANEERKKQNNLATIAKTKMDETFKDLKEMFTLAGIFKIILDAAINFNKTSVNISKNLGYGAANADRVANDLTNMARGSENLNVTLKNAAEAMDELNKATGLSIEYSKDALETQIMLTKQLGLTGEEAAGIYKFGVLTGKSSEKINDEMVGAFVATRNSLKVGANFKEVMAEAAKVSGQLAANFKNNPAAITAAVVQAKALGTTLEQTKSQGESLLNFESSIENELKAELLTGKAMNLERARAAALAGDQVTVMKELNNQGMTFDKFQKLNVIAQKSFAEALGLSADQLANQLRQQKLAQETGKSLAQITKEEALEAEKRQNIQDKFNAAVEKLKDIIGGLVAGPLGMMLSILSDALGLIGKIVAGIQEVLGSGLTKVLLGTITGLAVGGPVGALIGGIAGAASAAIADDMVGYGARTLITPSGPIALNNNDTVIAGTNLFKGDDVMSFGKGALSLGGGDNSDVIAAIKELGSRPAVIAGARPFANVLGAQTELFTSGMQNQSKLA